MTSIRLYQFMTSIKHLFTLLIVVYFSDVNAQFTTNGDASDFSCNCFEVTPDEADQLGSFYQDASVDLTTDFELKFTVNFGCEGAGGEGLAFVLQPAGWDDGLGAAGLGYQSIAGNSLTVEFDTRDNYSIGEEDNWDIPADHISLQDNGDTFHEADNPNNLLGTPSGLNIGEDATPHNIKPGFPEIEDCEDHLIEISWTAGVNQTIEVKVDGLVTLTYIGDMITEQFDGETSVLWGWTGSTGIFTNLQTVCLAVQPDFVMSDALCTGDPIDFTDNSVSYYDITDWEWDFGGLGDDSDPNPSFVFDEAGIYDINLTITDESGCENTITKTVQIGFEVEISADDEFVCLDGETILHAEGVPFEATECCFKLVMKDLWGDHWGSGTANEIEILVDGETYGSYTPTSYSPGTPTSDTVELCFDQGAELEFIIHGEDSPSECSYFFLSEDDTEILYVDGSEGGTWFEGASQTHTVDCGIDPPTYTYQWNNEDLLSDDTDSDPTATLTESTWFNVVITDEETGCAVIDSIFIGVHPPVNAVISGMDTVCLGDEGILTIAFEGPMPYTIDITGPDGPLPSITDIDTETYELIVSEDGDYIITAVTGAGCVGTFSGTGNLEVITPFAVEVSEDATYCDGDELEDMVVIATDGGTIEWFNNPDLIPPVIGTGMTHTPDDILGTTTYYIVETESIFGCVGPIAEVTITINPVPPAPTYSGETIYCEGDIATEIVAIPTMDGNIIWYDDLPPDGEILAETDTYTPTLEFPGTIIYIVEELAGCISPPTAIEIIVNPTPDPPAVDGVLEYCEGDEATPLTATPTEGGEIEWRTEGGIVLASGTNYTPILIPGETEIHVVEVLGDCESEPTIIIITVLPAPYIIAPDSLAICKGDSVYVEVETNGELVVWSDGTIGTETWILADETTEYTITASNPGCGASSTTFTLVVNPPPYLETMEDTSVGLGGEIELWAYSTAAGVYEWNPDVACINSNCSEVVAFPSEPTMYYVEITDQNGCTSIDSIFVDINGIMELFVPNVFSPNNDGYNDILFVLGPKLSDFKFEIYDRWGKRVYYSKEQNKGWDGTFNGQLLAPQTFVYRLIGEDVTGKSHQVEGNVTIID